MPFKRFNHPTAQKGEIVLTNTTPALFEAMKWETKRHGVGNQAYDAANEPIDPARGISPVFVQYSEFRKKGFADDAVF